MVRATPSVKEPRDGRAAALIRETGKKIDFYKRNALARRLAIMKRLRIGVVLDVGANAGQYAKELRRAGYVGRIVSFEPCSSARATLERRARRDGKWRAVGLGLGAHDHEATLRVSGDSRASSLVRMLPLHEQCAPYFASQTEERVSIRKLDTIWDEHVPARGAAYLKIDTQGYEREVLEGAARSLDRVAAIQMEMSLQRLYEGEMLMPEAIELMGRKGYKLVSLEYGFCHPETAEMLQVDGIFARTS